MRYIFWLSSLLFSFNLIAQHTDTRNKFFDILHTNIYLSIPDFSNKQIVGTCTHEILVADASATKIPFDLLALEVDSILIGGQVTYSYNDTLLLIDLPANLQNGDTISIVIHYHGTPVMDATGWGGFYFSGDYVFNLGVGFGADPHNYGRVWYPCFDNFIEKSTYSFNIRVDSIYTAYCNGLLAGVTVNTDGTRIWKWHLNQPIPSYLVCVAVSNYTHANWLYQGEQSIFPVYLIAKAGDTTKMKSSFVHLNEAIEVFEKNYGPQVFDKVGFVSVPFNGGAMEHATSIAYPKFALDGSTNFETLMAHELSHHWWGDHVTCASAEDMWINEGWASFSEALFLEHVYGKERYASYVAANHKKVLHFAHVNDEGYRAISGVPHEFTYGTHVYDKGADVVHTLRNYLGDSLFSHCSREFMTAYSFSNASSNEFRDFLTACSGIDMADFFDGWVFNPGFPHFSVDSMSYFKKDGKYNTSVYIRQRLNHAPALYRNVPLEITFFDANWNTQTEKLIMDGECGVWHVRLDFEPVLSILDMDEKISDAISSEQRVINAPGQFDLPNALLNLGVVSFSGDSILVRIEHNWIPPDPMKNKIPGLHLSDYRYWKIDGWFLDDWVANAVIKYDGSNSNTNGHLDNSLITNVEDSIVVMYRKSTADDWTLFPDFSVNTIGSNTNKYGQIVLQNLKRGEYTLAIYDHARTDTLDRPIPKDCKELNEGFQSLIVPPGTFKVFPNPGNKSITIHIGVSEFDRKIIAYNMNGQQIMSMNLKADEEISSISTSSWARGTYLVKAISDSEIIGTEKLVILH